MTKQELEKYEEMQNAFQTRCENICKMLIPLHRANGHVTEFRIDGEWVDGKGYEHWSYNIGDEVHDGNKLHVTAFPKEYIYMDDSEIQKIIDEELELRESVNTPKSNR